MGPDDENRRQRIRGDARYKEGGMKEKQAYATINTTIT